MTKDATGPARLHAERILGQFWSKAEKNKGAKAGKTGSKGKPLLDKTPTLAELGMTKKESARAQQRGRAGHFLLRSLLSQYFRFNPHPGLAPGVTGAE